MTSIFKSNKFFRIIKHFVLCIPLMFVLGTSIYTIVNPNAKDSYYGETINEEIVTSVSYDDLIVDNIYSYTQIVRSDVPSSISNSYIYIDLISANFASLSSYNSPSFDILDANTLRLRYFNGFILFEFSINGSQETFYYASQNFDISFRFLGVSVYSDLLTYINDFTYTTYNDYSYLNNAFAYGMYQFNQIGFNKFDFVGLFDGIFTDNIHNVYTDFINSYLNYYLMIECVYFVPWVIHMFIHFSYDLGDYFTSSFRRNKEDD